jgi:hypothetical protein
MPNAMLNSAGQARIESKSRGRALTGYGGNYERYYTKGTTPFRLSFFIFSDRGRLILPILTISILPILALVFL